MINYRAICKRCHIVMHDLEPNGRAEFYHYEQFADGKPNHCKNAGLTFYHDGKSFVVPRYPQSNITNINNEIEWFMRKRERRAIKRASK